MQQRASCRASRVREAKALGEAFNPGMRGGHAIAELVFGLIEPRGRLPISFARHVGQQPVYYNQVRGQHGDRYADHTQDPLFAFGEGLSYTTLVYSDLTLRSRTIPVDGSIEATVTVTNTGSRPATETIQGYISDLTTSVTWAEQELKAFTRAEIPPGQAREVHLVIPASRCSLVTADKHRVVEPGEFELRVGPSSRRKGQLTARFHLHDRTPNPGAEPRPAA